MKKIILIASLFVASFAFADEPQSSNVFSEAESSATTQEDENQYSTNSEPTGAGDPVSINEYLGVLAVLGAALAVYQFKNKKITS